MNLKLLLMKQGRTQLELAKKIEIHPALLSMQINLHKMLPEKYLPKFCSEMGISRKELDEAMAFKGGSNE